MRQTESGQRAALPRCLIWIGYVTIWHVLSSHIWPLLNQKVSSLVWFVFKYRLLRKRLAGNQTCTAFTLVIQHLSDFINWDSSWVHRPNAWSRRYTSDRCCTYMIRVSTSGSLALHQIPRASPKLEYCLRWSKNMETCLPTEVLKQEGAWLTLPEAGI